MPAAPPPDTPSGATPPLSDAAPKDPAAARREKLLALKAMGVDPWGGRLDGHTPIAQVRQRSAELRFRFPNGMHVDLPDFDSQPEDWQFRQWKADRNAEHGGERGEIVGPGFRVAGRIVLHRKAGKLHFIDLQDMTGRLQMMVGQKQVGDSWRLVDKIDLGDIIAVDGKLTRTNTGELSIAAERLHYLTKCLTPPPEKHSGLRDAELRQRMRYVDLAFNEGVMRRFLDRSRIVQSVRRTLASRGFVEVEGPTLHGVAGGAAARPFTTHHNALDLNLFLRIALELHLKRLLVGGVERVFELGRVYRNEGISPKHNPEFTMLEVYQAYGDYGSMMDLTESIITAAIAAAAGGGAETGGGGAHQSAAAEAPPSPAPNYVLPWGEKTIDFTPPFQRQTYDQLFRAHTGVDPADRAAVAQVGEKIGVPPRDQGGAPKHPDVLKNEVFEAKVEDQLVGPVFVTDYPASICPLTKRKRDNPHVAERFELFVDGMEVANAYTELNDPDLQEQLFKAQLAGQDEEDTMARMDDDFLRALRHGMPPAGGLGIGIDRLVMLLTNSQSIRDVILFPLLRPES